MVVEIPSAGVRVGYCTDPGEATPTVRALLRDLDVLIVESNHDPVMLRNGPYPFYLQERIVGRGGHLSNDACAAVLPGLVAQGTTRLVLAHLSRQNNTPQRRQVPPSDGIVCWRWRSRRERDR